jgi:hypothetical protein
MGGISQGCGGTPAGSDGQVQINASGTFGAVAGTTWASATGALTMVGATITADSPILNVSQTWNNSGVAFNGIKANFIATASAAGSLLLDLQVSGVSKFKVDQSGNVTIASNFTRAGVLEATSGGGVAIKTAASGLFGWVPSTNTSVTIDTAFVRDSAGVIKVIDGSGNARDIKVRSTIQTPPATITPANNGELVVEATANTTLTFRLKGTDGTVRSATLTLS